MSVELYTLPMSDDDDDVSDRLKTFCIQLVHYAQWKSVRSFMCGSHIEIPLNPLLSEHYHINHEQIDIDYMRYRTNQCASNQSVKFTEAFQGSIIRICTDDVHAGYVRLIREKDNTEVLMSDLCKLESDQMRHGPALLTDGGKELLKRNYSLSNRIKDTSYLEDKTSSWTPQGDIVHAVHSPYWPVEASEWITRRRCHDFPSKSVIKKVVRYGCDFVQVSHNRLCNDGEWRFSFSKAELFLIKSWTLSQRIVYTTLWLLNKKMIASSNLCSYYFKTLMFWTCEKKPVQFWHDDLLVQSVCELLIEMMKCLKSKFCVNYFIPSNNMMDHLIDTDLSYEIDALWGTSQIKQLISQVIDNCCSCELHSANVTYHIELPSWVKRAFVISESLYNQLDKYTDSLGKDLTIALCVELSDICIGLNFQQKFVSCGNVLKKNRYFIKSETHLLAAVHLCDAKEKHMKHNCSEEFAMSITIYFMRCNPDVSSGASNHNVELNTEHRSTADRQNSLNGRSEQKCLLYNRSKKKLNKKLVTKYCNESINKGRSINIVKYISIKPESHSAVAFYTKWPGRSPTVNISWFIAKAYLANFYYTTQHDVSLTIKTCDDIIEVYGQSQINQIFAENTFPVLLSMQWTNIYDKEIQEQLGFYSLCSHVLDKSSSHLVYLSVCPVLFALYLRVRIAVDQYKGFRRHRQIQIPVGHIVRFAQHMDACGSYQMVKDGHLCVGVIIKHVLKSCLKHDL